MWEWTSRLPGALGTIRWGFTAARGGTGPAGRSREPYAGLNLGGHVGDDPADVLANRRALAADLGVHADQVLFMNQVHGAHVEVVHGPWPVDDVEPGTLPPADAMVTDRPGLVLGVLVADCVPVLLADPERGVVGVAHAGRPGLVAGVVPAVVTALRDLGATGLVAAVGPSVCGRCYEVPEPMRAEVARVAPLSATVSWTGTPAVDVAAGVVAQLTDLGVPLTWVPGCTRESGRLYSYRRNQVTGRFAGVVVRDPS